jgi:hypothetical protein
VLHALELRVLQFGHAMNREIQVIGPGSFHADRSVRSPSLRRRRWDGWV